MECRARIRTRVSMVVALTDGYTGRPVSGGNINVFLQGHSVRPLRKAEGYFIFTNLNDHKYVLTVHSDIYLERTLTVYLDKLDPLKPFVNIVLQPAPAYPFPPGSTVIRGSLHSGFRGAVVTATITSEDCVRAKLLRDTTPGAAELCLVSAAGRLRPGDRLWIKATDELSSEYCQIATVSGEENCYQLTEALKFSHLRGAPVFSALQTYTDQRGEFVVYFNNLVLSSFNVSLIIEYESKVLKRGVGVDEGMKIFLGAI